MADEGDFTLKEGYIFDQSAGRPLDERKPEEEVRQENEKGAYEDIVMARYSPMMRSSKIYVRNNG